MVTFKFNTKAKLNKWVMQCRFRCILVNVIDDHTAEIAFFEQLNDEAKQRIYKTAKRLYNVIA